MQNNILQKFQEYMENWKQLDSFRLGWWFKYPLYLPFGFWLEMNNLNKKHKLTKEYNDYLNSLTSMK
jgi:hypothetical protein